MSTTRPSYTKANLAGPNAIGAPRDDIGPNAIGVPESLDPGPAAGGFTIEPVPYVAPVTFAYNLDAPLPVGISMATTTPGATIYYTEDGTEPTDGSSLYTGPFEDMTEPVESSGNYYYRAVAYVPGHPPSAVTTATGDDFGVIDLVQTPYSLIWLIVLRNDVHVCTGIICSDKLLSQMYMLRLWTVNGDIDWSECPNLSGFYCPVGIVTGNISLVNSGTVGVNNGPAEFDNLQTVGTINISGCACTDLYLTSLERGTVIAVNATELDYLEIPKLKVGSIVATGCALFDVDDIFISIARQIGPGFAVTTINLSGGTSAAPTAASLAARTALAAAGCSITTN